MKKVILSLSILAAFNSLALETDQFITSNIKLNDSADVINGYFHEKIEEALIRANKKNQSCNEAAYTVLRNITGRFSISNASKFATKSPLVDRFPDDSVSNKEYIKISFYENAWFLLKMVDMARTINMNGVYMGTDKIGHFSLVGTHYYRIYLKLIETGIPHEKAVVDAIKKGMKSEFGMLGYDIGGVLSYGDLEANYQGLMFALDMCHGENPILKNINGEWTYNPTHRFDVKNYFNPKMDESFNPSFWRGPLYKRIESKLKDEYCANKESPMFKDRVKHYNSIMTVNLNDKIIKEYVQTQDRFKPELERLDTNCP